MTDQEELDPITEIRIKGFKSFAEEQSIKLSPLTLLAGVNSSGKSSALQPLLLLKQTLESSYDPGPLLLDGPHVQFTAASQILSRTSDRVAEEFEVCVVVGPRFFSDTFRKTGEQFDLVRMTQSGTQNPIVLEPGMPGAQIEKLLPGLKKARKVEGDVWEVKRNRCFLGIVPVGADYPFIPFTYSFDQALRSIIHVPGLRGNPARTYNVTAVARHFQGTFEEYVASVVASWQQTKDERLDKLGDALRRLGLSWTVKANQIDATKLEILVGRLAEKRNHSRDLVNIADVGFGVSQVLPVLVALLAAEPGRLIYIEQPELHLHPRAQQVLASVISDAADRGVRVVAETHSSILLLAVQTLVAEGSLSPKKVKLHWFQRDSRGATEVTSGALDLLGAYGNWPEDFGEVMAASENSYLDAVETRSLRLKKNAKK